jgi:hypothetical protein
MKAFGTFCAAIILILPIVAHAQGAVIPPSGDKTGKTDGAAINAALSANLSATLACNATYYTDVSLQVPAGANFVGCGYNSQITGVGTITGGIVQLSAPAVDHWATQLVGNFQIMGGTATEAVLAGGPQDVGPYIGVHMFNIWVSGGTYTNEFWFSYFFNNQADNLIAGGGTVSAACFHFDGAVNADVFNNLSATCGAPYGFYMENDGNNGTSTGDTFNTVNAEGGCGTPGPASTCAGIYVGGQFSAITFNGVYTENVLHPIVLGNAATNEGCNDLTFDSPSLTGPSTISADAVALVDIDDCTGVVFNAPQFGVFGIDTSAPLTFSGGGCSTEPTAVAIPNPSGVIRAVTLTYPGAGCTSAPTVAVGGAGTGASIKATEAGGIVTGLTISAAGTGYTLGNVVPIVYTSPSKATIFNPQCFTIAQLAAPCWPWLVRSGATPAEYVAQPGVQIEGDTINIPGTGAIPAELKYTGYGNQYYVEYLDSSGANHLLSVVPQVYP